MREGGRRRRGGGERGAGEERQKGQGREAPGAAGGHAEATRGSKGSGRGEGPGKGERSREGDERAFAAKGGRVGARVARVASASTFEAGRPALSLSFFRVSQRRAPAEMRSVTIRRVEETRSGEKRAEGARQPRRGPGKGTERERRGGRRGDGQVMEAFQGLEFLSLFLRGGDGGRSRVRNSPSLPLRGSAPGGDRVPVRFGWRWRLGRCARCADKGAKGVCRIREGKNLRGGGGGEGLKRGGSGWRVAFFSSSSSSSRGVWAVRAPI